MVGILLAALVLVAAVAVVLVVALGGEDDDDSERADDDNPGLGLPGTNGNGDGGDAPASSGDPQQVVADYLEAATTGDCAAAREFIVDAASGHCEQRVVALDPTDAYVAGSESNGESVEVKVVYVIDDREDSDYFVVEQQDGAWQISMVRTFAEKEAGEGESEPTDAGPTPEELAQEAVKRWISIVDSGACDRATEAATEEYAASCERGVETWHEGYELDDWWERRTKVIDSGRVEVGVFLSGRPGTDGSAIDTMSGHYVVVLEDGAWKVADSELQID